MILKHVFTLERKQAIRVFNFSGFRFTFIDDKFPITLVKAILHLTPTQLNPNLSFLNDLPINSPLIFTFTNWVLPFEPSPPLNFDLSRLTDSDLLIRSHHSSYEAIPRYHSYAHSIRRIYRRLTLESSAFNSVGTRPKHQIILPLSRQHFRLSQHLLPGTVFRFNLQLKVDN